MNNKVLIAIIIVLAALLVWVWMGQRIDGSQIGGINDVPPPCPESASKTYSVYETDHAADEHIGAYDTFKINKTGSTYKLIPLTQMRNRWGKSPGFVVDLVVGPDNRLCGKVTLNGHTANQNHLYNIKDYGADKKEVVIEDFRDGETLPQNCDVVENTHGGIAHAES